MSKMKILNLYSGIGGNRKLWDTAYFPIDVTAVEYDSDIAAVYQKEFPDDKVIVEDAHTFLLNNFQDYDFIWSSPPCPSHSQYRYNVGVLAKGYKPLYPDMTLYQEIILLKYHFRGRWVVENTISYYEPLVKPQKISRHYFWSNFRIPNIEVETTGIRDKNKISELEEVLGFHISKTKIPNKRQVLRNCVNPILGLAILEASLYRSGWIGE